MRKKIRVPKELRHIRKIAFIRSGNMATNGANGDILAKRFFYVAQSKEGSIRQGYADTAKQFRGSIRASALSWLDYTVDDVEGEAVRISEHYGFSKPLIRGLLDKKHTGYEDFDSELGLRVPAIYVRGMDVEISPVYILINKSMIITIHSHKLQRFIRFRRYADSFMRKVPKKGPQADKLTLLLIRLLDENNSRNFDHLREIEEQGDNLAKWMMDAETPRSKLGPEIYKMKHALIVYLSALWVTLDVINNLRYGDATLITDDDGILGRIELLSSDLNRQIGLSEHMSEVLASGLEVLQSIYNNQLQVLNNRMAYAITYLTIIGTAVLVPNTIATILSNPAFNMTGKDEVWYLALLAGSTIVSTALAYWWVRSQKWFPKNLD